MKPDKLYGYYFFFSIYNESRPNSIKLHRYNEWNSKALNLTIIDQNNNCSQRNHTAYNRNVTIRFEDGPQFKNLYHASISLNSMVNDIINKNID